MPLMVDMMDAHSPQSFERRKKETLLHNLSSSVQVGPQVALFPDIDYKLISLTSREGVSGRKILKAHLLSSFTSS